MPCETVKPIFSQSVVPLVFAANDSFCPILSVMLRSVIDHADPANNYDIIILHRDITEKTAEKIKGMRSGRANISVRFVNVSQKIEGYQLYIGGKEDFSIDTYLRFFIPEVLSTEYRTAIYLDGDMIARDDVAQLMQVDVSDCLLAACRDMSGLEAYYTPDSPLRKYRDSCLRLQKPENYFIAGLLIMNLDRFRSSYTAQDMLQLAASRQWRQHDQDVLNLLCDGGKAKIIHVRWNLIKKYRPEILPPPLFKELEEAYADPKIVHYGGTCKPWKTTDTLYFDEFWQLAARTPFYGDMVRNIIDNIRVENDINDVMVECSYNGKVALHRIFRTLIGWLDYKTKNVWFKKRPR